MKKANKKELKKPGRQANTAKKRVLKSFKELEQEWGRVVLFNHLADKNKDLTEKELLAVLNELKQEKIIRELKRGCFVG